MRYLHLHYIYITYRKYDSVTNMLLVLGLPSCDTIWHNAKVVFNHAYLLLTIELFVYFLEISFLSFLCNIFFFYSIISLYFLFFYCDMDPCGLMQIN